MADTEEKFLSRWSRRKRAAAKPASPAPATPPTPARPAESLPAPESLTFESDFQSFLHDKVEESVKRAALKKLFADPRFNVMDGLDVYVDDYSKDDPIPEAMLAQLEHSKATLAGGRVPEEGAPVDGDGASGTERPGPGLAASTPPPEKDDGDPEQNA
jgi:hypothetical protein